MFCWFLVMTSGVHTMIFLRCGLRFIDFTLLLRCPTNGKQIGWLRRPFSAASFYNPLPWKMKSTIGKSIVLFKWFSSYCWSLSLLYGWYFFFFKTVRWVPDTAASCVVFHKASRWICPAECKIELLNGALKKNNIEIQRIAEDKNDNTLNKVITVFGDDACGIIVSVHHVQSF